MLSASWWFLYQKDVPRKLAFFITNLYCILETAFPYLYPLILKIRWTQNPLLSLFNKWREARPRNLCISHSPTWSSCLVIQVCPTLSDPKDCSLSGSSVHGILQARILECIAQYPGDLAHPGIKPSCFMSPALSVRFFNISATREVHVHVARWAKNSI